MSEPSPFERYVRTIHDLGLPEASASELPPIEYVLAAREALGVALRDPSFLVDCITRDVERLATDGAPVTGMIPFFHDRDHGIRFALGAWASGMSTPPHEHSGWNISAVMHNELEVRTYDRDAARAGRLVQKNVYRAPAGKVGFIYEPGVHAPRNPTQTTTISIHLMGPHDQDVPIDGATPGMSLTAALTDARLPMAQYRETQRYLRAEAAALAAHPGQRTTNALARMIGLGNSRTRQIVLDVLGAHAPEVATKLRSLHRQLRITTETRLEAASGRCPRRYTRQRGERVELVTDVGGAELVLLRVGIEARRALDQLASDEALQVGDLEGLSASDQVRLAEALDEWRVFIPSSAVGVVSC